MKLATNTHTLETGNLNVVRNCQIKQSAAAFQILSNALYSDKITAVIRELACNAYDAHRSVGLEHVPFTVRLPTHIHSELVISDQGPGLCEQDIYDLYTTYFSSSKTDSDEHTGCFGLGSKSPIAYTDSFTVVSRHGHTQATYTVFLNEEGVPQVTKLDQQPYVGPTGLSVRIPCQKSDTAIFQHKAHDVLRHFSTLPACYPDPVPPKQFLIDTPTLKTPIHPALSMTDINARVVMGNVAYPIENSENLFQAYRRIAAQYPSLCIWDAYTLSRWIRKRLEFHVPIGTMHVTPSRESLSYDALTTDNLAHAILQSRVSIGKYITELNNQPRVWDQVHPMAQLHDILGDFSPELVVSALGVAAPTSLFRRLEPMLQAGAINILSLDRGKRTKRIQLSSKDIGSRLGQRLNTKQIIVTSCPMPSLTRQLNLVQRQTQPFCLNQSNTVVIQATSDAVKAEILDLLDGCTILTDWDDFFDQSGNITPTHTRTSQVNRVVSPSYYVLSSTNCATPTDRKTLVDLIGSTEVVFRHIGKFYKDRDCTQALTEEALDSARRFLSSLGHPVPNTLPTLSKAQAMMNWTSKATPLWDRIHAKITQWISDPDAIHRINQYRQVMDIQNTDGRLYTWCSVIVSDFPSLEQRFPNNPFTRFNKLREQALNQIGIVSRIDSIYDQDDRNPLPHVPHVDTELTTTFKLIQTLIPWFVCVSPYRSEPEHLPLLETELHRILGAHSSTH